MNGIILFGYINFTCVSKVCSRGYGRVDNVTANLYTIIILSHFVFIYFVYIFRLNSFERSCLHLREFRRNSNFQEFEPSSSPRDKNDNTWRHSVFESRSDKTYRSTRGTQLFHGSYL